MESFGVSGGGTNYRESVDAALDDLATELETRLSREWLDTLLG
jgi:adenosylcobyric acid synthase